MRKQDSDIFMENKIFKWIAAGTLLLLSIPLLLMQLSSDSDWNLFDFIVGGGLMFGMGSAFVLVARKIRKTKSRIIAGVFFVTLTLYIWAELAVGIFTNLGS